jgi:hypothetical protein
MAQTIKLKRTAVQGKIPTTTNLDLGELAINTYDGRIFFEKDVDGTLSIQEILTTNSQTSGSFNLTGAISASSLNISGDTTIDGNLVLGGNITIGDSDTDTIVVAADFSGSIIPDGNELYDLGSSIKKWNNVYVKNVRGTDVYGSTSVQSPFITGSLLRLDENGTGLRMTNVGAFDNDNGSFRIFSNQDLIFSTNGSSGTALTLNETSKDANFVGAVTASHFVGDGSGLTNLNTEVSQVTTVTSSFEDVSTISVNHSFDSKNVIVSVYGTDYSQIIPQTVTLTDNDTVDIVLSSNHSGHVVVAKGGHIIASSDLDSYRLDVSGTSSYAVSHSLDEEYPFVQAWNTDSNQMEQPLSVESTSANSLTVEFSGNFAGKIIVKK